MATADVIVQNDASPPEAESLVGTGETSGDQSSKGGTKRELRTIRNQTPHRLLISNTQRHVVVLAPLEERQVDMTRWPTDALEQSGLVSRHDETSASVGEVLSQLGTTAIVVGIISAFVVAGEAQDHPAYAWEIWVGSGLGVLLVASVALLLLLRRTSVASRILAQAVTLAMVLAISVFLPIGVVDRFADEDISSLRGVDVFVRVIQITIISIASMLPGLLFFFFDRQKLSTLRNRFERQIFRLDPHVMTLADVYARYGDQLEETYGSAESRQGNRLARQRRWPILLATLVLTVGWIIALAPVGVLPPGLSAAAIPSVLAPGTHPVVFGFLGSYFFALNLIWRRYTRGDLRPKAYSAITVRILVVLVVTWVISATMPPKSDWVLVASFLIGIVPETAFVFWRETISGLSKAFSMDAFEETQPLQDLEGVDIYDRARLQDEGISNVQALAHHELVDLLLETRIPAGRLVDWVDQAILYLHCGDASAKGRGDLQDSLQGVGIRTATDFENAMTKGPSRRALLEFRDQSGHGFQESILVVLLASLRDDEWMSYVRHWRDEPAVKDITVDVSEDGLVARVEPPVFAGILD